MTSHKITIFRKHCQENKLYIDNYQGKKTFNIAQVHEIKYLQLYQRPQVWILQLTQAREPTSSFLSCPPFQTPTSILHPKNNYMQTVGDHSDKLRNWITNPLNFAILRGKINHD